jgi:hypothetical protein
MNWNRVNNELSNAILQTERLDELLTSLGCNLIDYSGWGTYRGPCPVHSGEDANFQLRTEGDVLPIHWKCYSHGCEQRFKPTLLGLVRGVLTERDRTGVTLQAAVSFLRTFLPDGQPTPVIKPRERTGRQGRRLRLTRQQVRKRLEIPSPYFVSRGFSPEILDAMDVGHSRKKGRTIVPLYDPTGEVCIGYLSRSESPDCLPNRRWYTSDGFPKGSYLYNEACTRRSDSSPIFLVEGAGEVFKIAEAGYPAVALLGSDLTDAQQKRIAKMGKKVVVAFDNDPPGREKGRIAHMLLSHRGVPTQLWFPPEGFKDIGEMPAGEVKRWIEAQP